MTSGRRTVLLVVAALAVAASAAYVGYAVGRGKAGEAPAADEGEKTATVTTVRTVTAAEATMDQTVTAYGTIAAAPEELQTVSVPFECRVGRITAAPGQAVTEGSLLLAIEPSPDSQLQLDEARSNRAAAAHDLALVEQRMAMKLAINQDLSTAKQAMDLAQLRLDNIEKRAIAPKQIKAERTGIVNQINVREGQIIAAGGTLMELVATGRIEARLGVEPSAMTAMQPGQLVRLCTVQGTAGGCILGHVRLITQKVNQASRLVDVFVSLPLQSPLKLETYVRAEVVLASRTALVVPHSAVLPDGEEGQVLYTIKDGKAVKHQVKTGLEDTEHVEILGGEIKAGEAVIVQGNYEVEDGQAVRVEQPGEKNPGPGEEKSGGQTATAPVAAEKTP